jgi:hypothetical protein
MEIYNFDIGQLIMRVIRFGTSIYESKERSKALILTIMNEWIKI